MPRHIALSVVLWAGFAFVVVACIEAIAFGRFEWTESVSSAIGLGIGLAFAERVVPFRRRES